ncbi:MAG: hypothetical protein HRU80_03095 [Ignavibacteriales bacterium]|nr:MAG: hypothetical protein HRU80_03095 [Ignavibacteriales bacterium]
MMKHADKPALPRRILIMLLAAAHLNLAGCQTVTLVVYNADSDTYDEELIHFLRLKSGEIVVFNNEKGMHQNVEARLKGKTVKEKDFTANIASVREMIAYYPEGKAFSKEKIVLAKEVHLLNGLYARCNQEGFRFDERTGKVSGVSWQGREYIINPDSIELMYFSFPEVINMDTLKNNTVYYPQALLMMSNLVVRTGQEGVRYLEQEKKITGTTVDNIQAEIDINEVESIAVYQYDLVKSAIYGLSWILGAVLIAVLVDIFEHDHSDPSNTGVRVKP